MRKWWYLTVLIVSAVPAARADYALLRSGQRLHITGYERGAQTILLHMEGGTVEVPANDLVRIEPEDFFPPPPPPPAADGTYAQIIRAAAEKNGVDEALISSVISVESNFNPRAISRKQARGLMQLVPTTAARYSVANAFDPAQNVEGGTRYLKDLLDQYHGDLGLALAAYNAGPERVQQYRGIPPYSETRAYVKRVTKKLEQRKKKPKPTTDPASR